MSRRIEAREPRNGGNQVQHAKRVSLTLRWGLLGPVELDRPAELAFNLLDELPDLVRGGLCLGTLDADKPGGVIPVRAPHLDHAADEQGGPDREYKERRVFAKQAAAQGRKDEGVPIRRDVHAVASLD